MPPALLSFYLFFNRILHFCLGASLSCNPPIYASLVAEIIDIQLICPVYVLRWRGGGLSNFFCLGWPWTMIFLIFTYWVAGITCLSYCAWLALSFLGFSFIFFFPGGTGVPTQGLTFTRQCFTIWTTPQAYFAFLDPNNWWRTQASFCRMPEASSWLGLHFIMAEGSWLTSPQCWRY
jgi:hypothetical protein